LPKIILIDAHDSVRIFDEGVQADVLVQQIRNGLWKPPEFSSHGPYHAVQEGNTLVVTTLPRAENCRNQVILTARDVDILQGLATGLTDNRIADTLGIKPRTVRFYIDRLKTRLGALTREHLVAKAGGLGLLDLSTNAEVNFHSTNIC
jgi:DNA-binding CsgD family transcriptional regulator